MMTPSERLPGTRWWRVIGGALSLELGLTLVSIVLVAMGRASDLMTFIPPATLPIAALTGYWVARRTACPVRNAALAGAIAIPVYVAIVVVALIVAPEQSNMDAVLSPAYLTTHCFKVLGAAFGGWLIARRN